MTPVEQPRPPASAISVSSSPVRTGALPLSARALHISLLAVYTALYLLITIPIASKRLLWNDELFTLTISRQSFHEMWRLLNTGADQLPPAFCAISHAAFALWGPHELSARAPEIFGFWLLGVCLFELTASRTSPLHGAIAAFLPCLTAGFLYSYEARPYGLVLGFAALALLLWQKAGAENPSPWALAGFALALMAATSVHYYAIFVALPFGAAEALRLYRERWFRAPVWVAIAASVIPAVLAAPLIRTASRVAHHFWSRAQLVSISDAYGDLLAKPFLTGVMLAALTGFFVLAFRFGEGEAAPRRPWRPPVHEVIPVAAFALMPLIIVPIARVTTGAFASRYAVTAIIGVCVLIAWLCYVLTANHRWATCLILGAVMACVGFAGLRTYRSAALAHAETFSVISYLESQPGALPIVISDPHLFFQLSHYAAPPLANRLVYLADIPLAVQHTGTDTLDLGMLVLGPVSGARVAAFAAFVKSTPRFLVYGYPAGRWGWAVPELLARHIKTDTVGIFDDLLLFSAQSGGA